MAEHDWKQLLDDPEVERIVRMVNSVTPRTGNQYLDNDRESYLWDRCVDVAIGYTPNIEPRDPKAYWYAYLWKVLKRAALYQAAYEYGQMGTAKREAEYHRRSLDEALDEGDNVYDLYDYDVAPVIDLGDRRYPDAPGYHRLTRSDPLAQLILLERYESTLRHINRQAAATGVYITPTSTSGLCEDPECFRHADRGGLCNMHYQRWRDRWGNTTKETATCSGEGCERPATGGKGMCGAHFQAWRRNDPDAPRCLDCDRAAISKGRCTYHATKARKRGAA